MRRLEKKYKNILIFFITTLFNIIMINNFCNIANFNYKVVVVGTYAMLIPVYIVAYIKNHSKIEKIIRVFNIGVFLGSVAVSLIHYLSKIVYIMNNFGFQNFLKNYGNKALIIYFIISFLQPIVLPVPEPITIMAGSSVFGAFNGAVIGFLGTVLGIITMYVFIRATGGKFIEKFVSSKQIEKFNRYIKKNEFIVILSLFILPILPDEAICVGAGLTKVTSYKFIGIAIISKIITAFSLSYSVKIIKINSLEIALILLGILAIKKLVDMRKLKIKQRVLN